MKRLFGTNGIRFILGEDLNVDDIVRIGMAVGTFFKGGKCLLGRDIRKTGEVVAQAITSGLMATGCNVYDIGLITTPALQFTVKVQGFDFGVMITASHNPPEYNGIKVIDHDGVEIERSKEERIEDIYFHEKFTLSNWRSVGRHYYCNNEGIIEEYIKAVIKHIDADVVKGKKFTVVIDPANSVGILTTPRLAKILNCRVLTINGNLDGDFPGREPEPRPDNLEGLATAVVSSGADFGVAHDGDGDRAIFVDEKGNIHWGDRSGALIVEYYLREHPGETVITPVSSSVVIEEVARRHGGRVVYTKVGSIHVSRKMLELKAPLGVEENGGVFFGPHHPVRDGTMTTALILNILAKEENPLSKLMARLPKYYQMKLRVPCPNELKENVLKVLREATKDMKVDHTDGVKIWYDRRSWVLIRPSGTEPIFRIYAEADDKSKLNNIVNKAKNMLEDAIDEVTKKDRFNTPRTK